MNQNTTNPGKTKLNRLYVTSRYGDQWTAELIDDNVYRIKSNNLSFSYQTTDDHGVPIGIESIDFPGGPYISVNYEFPFDSTKTVLSFVPIVENGRLKYMDVITK